jgi:hypothetical protein
MPIFGIPLLGFSDYDPRVVETGHAMRHWHSVAQSNWKRMAYHVLSPQHKNQGSVIKQMLRQYWLNEAQAEVLQSDFTLGVNLSDRGRYHTIVEQDGDFVCVRFPDGQRPSNEELLSPKSAKLRKQESESANASKHKSTNISFQVRNKFGGSLTVRTDANKISPTSKSSKLSIKSFRYLSPT